MAEAACQGVEESVFFTNTSREAKDICGGCPVRTQCLDFSLIFGEYGVWGGMSEQERHRKYPRYIRESMREDHCLAIE